MSIMVRLPDPLGNGSRGRILTTVAATVATVPDVNLAIVSYTF
jgi:hypothetical protein